MSTHAKKKGYGAWVEEREEANTGTKYFSPIIEIIVQ
jgi:hypothetical protein